MTLDEAPRVVAIGNFSKGFRVTSGTHTLTGNAAIDNFQEGVFFSAGPNDNLTFTGGSLMGNDVGGANCGVTLVGPTSMTVKTTFWGAASGPGPDPADATCGINPTTVGPVSQKEIKVIPPAQR